MNAINVMFIPKEKDDKTNYKHSENIKNVIDAIVLSGEIFCTFLDLEKTYHVNKNKITDCFV